MASHCKLQAKLQSKITFFRLASIAYLAGKCTTPDVYACICAGLVVIALLRTALRLSKEEEEERKKERKKKEDEQFAWAAISVHRFRDV